MYYSLVLVFISHFIIDFMLGVWPAYKTLAHLDLGKAGLVVGMSMILGEVLQLYFGYLSDRGWQRKLAIVGILMTGSIGLLAYTNSYFLLFLIIFCLYLGSSAFHPAAIGLIGEWFQEKKGLYITLFFSGGTFGAAFSQILFTKAYHYFQGHTWILAIPAVFVAGWMLLNPFPKKAIEREKTSLKQLLHSIRPYQKRLSTLFFLLLCNQALIISFMFLLPDLLQGKYEDWIVFGGGHALFILGGAIFSIPFGYLTERFDIKKLLLLACCAAAPLFYVVAGYGVLPPPVLAIYLFLLGGMMGVVNPVIISAGCSIVPSNRSGFVAGLLMGASASLSGFSIIVAGALASLFIEDGASMALQLMGLLFLVMFAILKFTKFESEPKLA